MYRENGVAATCSKFETSKSEDSLRTFQDGRNPYVEGPVKKGDNLVKIDLKDASLTVSIWHKHQKYLRFLWKDNMWKFACLPFGLASAPIVFTQLLKQAGVCFKTNRVSPSAELFPPMKDHEVYPLGHLHLAGWIVSIDHSRRHKFLQRLGKCFCQPGSTILPSLMHKPGTSGITGVWNTTAIPFHRLFQQFQIFCAVNFKQVMLIVVLMYIGQPYLLFWFPSTRFPIFKGGFI